MENLKIEIKNKEIVNTVKSELNNLLKKYSMRIAFCPNHYFKIWENKDLTWNEILEIIFRHPVQVEFNLEEFKKLDSKKQNAIKGARSYLGGEVINHKRTDKNILYRSLITLDIDNPPSGFAKYIEENFPYIHVLHSTIKSTVEKPRYRLVIPMTSALEKDEYERAARMIAFQLGNEGFDKSTFEYSRMMFFPTVLIGEEYFIQEGGKEFLDPKVLLKSVPEFSELSPIVQKKIRLSNPLEKPGLIGIFNRCYTIEEAIKKYIARYL